MRIDNEPLLRELRASPRCLWCRKTVRRIEVDHVFPRGRGSAFRLDIRVNLAPLCGAFSGGEDCHQRKSDGHIAVFDLLAMIAQRERCLQDEIEAVIYLLRRLPKDARPWQVAREIADWSTGSRALLARTLAECNKGFLLEVA